MGTLLYDDDFEDVAKETFKLIEERINKLEEKVTTLIAEVQSLRSQLQIRVGLR